MLTGIALISLHIGYKGNVAVLRVLGTTDKIIADLAREVSGISQQLISPLYAHVRTIPELLEPGAPCDGYYGYGSDI